MIDRMIHFTPERLRRKFSHMFPWLAKAAREGSLSDFLETLERRVSDTLATISSDDNRAASARMMLELLRSEGTTIHEYSCGEDITLGTLKALYDFLRSERAKNIAADPFLDLFMALWQMEYGYSEGRKTDPSVRSMMKKWPSGMAPEVREIRRANKERIVELLIDKIETRAHHTTRFHFDEGLTREEKRELVLRWWNDHRFHLALAIKTPTELNAFLGGSLSGDTLKLLKQGRKKGMPFFITPYYLSLLNTTSKGYDDSTVRSYVIYTENLVETYGNIRAWEREDVVVPGKPNAAGWILPNANNIHRRYPEVAILIPDTMGRSCGGLCAVCQRMYDFQSKRLNFDFEELAPKESWEKKLHRLMEYFENDTQIRDILITGGDALMSQNKTLRRILGAVLRMAQNKKKANLTRPDGEKFAQMQRIRLGSRLPAYLPMRIDDELVEILHEFKIKAEAAGFEQFIVQTHFQSPLEVTPEAYEAIRKIRSAGWTVTNQLVFTAAASRRGHTAKLRRVLGKAGVVCYYTFSVKGFEENYKLFTPAARSQQERFEEKSAGELSVEQMGQLMEIISNDTARASRIGEFLKANDLPFAATDRNVLNLPGIGKSMTFRTVGLTPDGQRILRFEHDHTRRHSPIIDHMGQIHITENKSIAAYLRELESMGEHAWQYRSIWHYYNGNTEPRFKLFEYPDFDFATTDTFTFLELEEKTQTKE